MPTYTCHNERCRFTVAVPYCPSCNQFLTDDIDIAESVMEPLVAPERLDWCTAFGHWGDVFCCCGVMKSLMRQTGQEKVNVLYAGPDMDVIPWLKSQPFVGRVYGMEYKDDQYTEFWGATTKPGSTVDDWHPLITPPTLRQKFDPLPKAESITATHINHDWFQTRKGLPAQVWQGGQLPTEAHRTAQMILQEAVRVRSGQLYHLHPLSTSSELSGNHWAHWLAAIEWLIEKTPHTYLITGLEKIPYLPQSPRLINLIGCIKSNLDVMALSDYCDGVISTPNSIALWGVVRGHRVLCVGNKATGYLTSYYRRFLQRGERLRYMNVDTKLSEFQAAACEFFEQAEPQP